MKARWLTGVLIAAVAVLSGCAHPITMGPKLEEVDRAAATKSKKVAAYYIADADRNLAVVTPGGGGDKVTYKPYADLEYGLYRVLAKKYAAVHALKDPNDQKFLSDNRVSYVFQPKLVTDSRSESLLTWPPTEFTIEMECVANDPQGKPLWRKSVRGSGKAEFSEFKSNFSLSAERASTQVLLELQKALDGAKELQ